MRRKAIRTEPYYCSPETGCPSKDCPGLPIESRKNHGVHPDDWYFTVIVHEKQFAVTLVVFGTDLHPGIPAWHPIRDPSSSVAREPRAGYIARCTGLDPSGGDPEDVCTHLGVPCKGGADYLIASALWANCGDPAARLDQPESFWEGLELLARSWCECGGECCKLTDEEEARLTELAKLPKPEPVTDAQLAEIRDYSRGLYPQDKN